MATCEKLYFKVEGESLCRLVRSLYQQEGKERKALNILMEGIQGMTHEVALAICAGSKELRGVNEDMKLVDLDSSVDPAREAFRKATELREKLEASEDEHRDFIQRQFYPTMMSSPYGLIGVSRKFKKRLLAGEVTWADVPEDIVDRGIADMERQKRTADFFSGKRTPAENKLEQLSAKTYRPIEDKELASLNGWIDLDGRFWPCSYGKHEELADLLEASGREADEVGWVKVSNHEESSLDAGILDSDFMMQDVERGVTQSQYDTAYAWANKHKRKLPEWMEVKR